MGIWIISQDKKTLVESNGLTVKTYQDYDKKTYHIESISPIATLGVYNTEEKAKEILYLLASKTHEPSLVVDMSED